jgi:hypothetical protein
MAAHPRASIAIASGQRKAGANIQIRLGLKKVAERGSDPELFKVAGQLLVSSAVAQPGQAHYRAMKQ